jgi:hypothetical protein
MFCSFLQSLKYAEKNGHVGAKQVGPTVNRQVRQKASATQNGSRPATRYDYLNQTSAYSDDDSSDSGQRPRYSKERKETLRKQQKSPALVAARPPSRSLYDPDSQYRKQKSKKTAYRKLKKTAPKYGAVGGDCCHVSSSAEGLRFSRLSQSQSGPEVAAEYESKLKALRLRVKGQLETIRSLETQLAEFTHTLSTKDAQLGEAFKRLMVLEKKEKMRMRASQDEEKQLAAGSGRLRTEESKVFQLKVCVSCVCIGICVVDIVVALGG